MKELNFKLTIDQANTILEALGNMPYAKVYPIIQTIQQQAAEQLNGEENSLKSEPTSES